MKLRFLAILVLMIFLIGCQKHGLSIEFPKNYNGQKETVVNDVKMPETDFSQVPTTRAVVMKDGSLDLTTLALKKTDLNFADFTLKLIPDEKNDFFQVFVFEPRDYHNDYTIQFLLNPEGKVLAQAIVQRENGMMTAGDELVLRR